MITRIVIHCSASPQGRGDDAKTIHRWHMERGWSGIGYHWVILEDGTVQAGRPEYWTGAHVAGHNAGSIGVCLIGEDYFPEDQLRSLQNLVQELLRRHPQSVVVGHYELDPGKTCPNIDIPAMSQEQGWRR